MAGGIYNQPFTLNVKCIVFSLIIMTIFLYCPKIENNLVMGITLFTIFVISYVAMAWYDAFYNCTVLPLKRARFGITTLFKPEIHSEKQKTHEEDETDMRLKNIFIYVSHIIFIVPLLVYIGVYQNKVSPITYPLIMVLAVFTLLYHGLHLVYKSH